MAADPFEGHLYELVDMMVENVVKVCPSRVICYFEYSEDLNICLPPAAIYFAKEKAVHTKSNFENSAALQC